MGTRHFLPWLQTTLLITVLVGSVGCNRNEELDVASYQAGAAKSAGGTNGDGDFCNSNDCVAGEGDCDIDAHCGGAAGLACGTDNGAFGFGFGIAWDMCVPAHCTNGVRDIALGETHADCGGGTGVCGTNCDVICTGLPANGATGHCSPKCVCPAGEGDCTSDADCTIDTRCGSGNGPQFGFSSGKSACVDPSCINGVREPTERWIDCGGAACGDTCACDRGGLPIGSIQYCTLGCRCRAQRGHCESDAECEPDHTCVADIGPRFGFNSGFDVCLASHCTNGIQDGDEAGVDCGPSCLNCSGSLLADWSGGGSDEDIVQDVAIDSTGNTVVVGRFIDDRDFGGGTRINNGGTDVFVVKYDEEGNYLWDRTFGNPIADGDYGLDVAIGPGGDVVVVGNFYRTVDYGLGTVSTAGGADIFAVSFDGGTGAPNWQQRFGGTGRDLGRAVVFGPTGSLYMIGTYEDTVTFGPSTLTSRGDEDIFIAQLTPSTGVPVRARSYGGTAKDTGTSIATNGSAVYVAGHFNGTIEFGVGQTLTSTGTSDIFVARLSSTLATQTFARFGSFSSDTVAGMGVDNAGNVTIGGAFSQSVQFGTFTSTVVGGTDGWVAQLNSSLAVQWLSTFGSTGTDEVLSVAVEPVTGNVAAVGYGAGDIANFPGGAVTGLGSTDAFLVVYDSSGGSLYSALGGGGGADRAMDCSASANFLGVTGWFNGMAANFNGSTPDYSSSGARDFFVQRLGI